MSDHQRTNTIFEPAPLAVLLGTGTFLAALISYFLSAAYGHVPWCVVFWESCSSISAAGRKPPAFFTFKAMLLPLAGVMFLYWLLLESWLRRVENRAPGLLSTLSVLGLIATVALILYTTMLGAIGELYQLQRRIGIILFFGLTAFAHLLMLKRLWRLDSSRRPPWTRVQMTLSVLLLAGGVGNSVLKMAMGDDFDRLEDSIEWVFAVVMVSQFTITGLAWRDTGFRLSVT